MAKQCESIRNGVRCAHPEGHSYRHANGLTAWDDEPGMCFEAWLLQFNKLKAARAALAALLLFCAIAIAPQARAQLTTPILSPSGLTLPVLNVPTPVPGANVAALGGNPGQRQLYFWIVTQNLLGASNPAGPFLLTNAPNVLGSGSSVQINWSPAITATSYDLLLTYTPAPPSGACNCAVATGLTSTGYLDISDILGVYTVAPLNLDSLSIRLFNWPTGEDTTCAAIAQPPNGAPACIAGYVPPPPVTLYYQTVDAATVAQPQEPALNFSADFDLSDTPGVSTNSSLHTQSLTPGTYCAATFNSKGIATAGTACAQDEWINAAGCTTTGSCTATATWGAAFADTSYFVECTPLTATVSGAENVTPIFAVTAKTLSDTTITVYTVGTGIVPVGFASFDCHGHHN